MPSNIRFRNPSSDPPQTGNPLDVCERGDTRSQFHHPFTYSQRVMHITLKNCRGSVFPCNSRGAKPRPCNIYAKNGFQPNKTSHKNGIAKSKIERTRQSSVDTAGRGRACSSGRVRSRNHKSSGKLVKNKKETNITLSSSFLTRIYHSCSVSSSLSCASSCFLIYSVWVFFMEQNRVFFNSFRRD